MKQTFAALILLLTVYSCRNANEGASNDPTPLPEAEHVFEMDTVKGIEYGSFAYDSVVAFEIPLEHEVYSIVEDSAVMSGSYIKRKKLSDEQVSNVNSILNDTATYGTAPAACFEPHLVIAYFKANKVIAETTICVRCNSLFSTPRIAASHYYQYLDIVGSDTFQLVRNGFSDIGRERLGNLCNEFNFSHCKEK